MLKLLMVLSILIASIYAEASHDVSYVTINGKPTVEIVINDKVCHFVLTEQEMKTFTQKKASELIAQCRQM